MKYNYEIITTDSGCLIKRTKTWFWGMFKEEEFLDNKYGWWHDDVYKIAQQCFFTGEDAEELKQKFNAIESARNG